MNFSLTKYPEVSYGDYAEGRPLDYPSDSVDLVLSQHALNQGKLNNPRIEFPWIVSEVMRVMRIDGWALLHAGLSPKDNLDQWEKDIIRQREKEEIIRERMQEAG